jgi:hypothetical protein
LLVEKAAFGGDDITTDPQFDVLVSLMDAAAVAKEALDKSNEALKLVADCEEATENANAVREEIEAGGYIESLKELNDGEKFSFWVGTQAEYDELEQKQGNTLYLITDDTTEEDINTQIDNINNQLNQLEAAEGKMTLLYEYTPGKPETTISSGETVTALTNTKFPLYYITLYGKSTVIVAGGAWFDYEGRQGWVIRGSGVNMGANSLEEYIVSLTHIGDNLSLEGEFLRRQNYSTGEFAFDIGEIEIARIYGFGKL